MRFIVSYSLNNTRYLARDKCLNRRIPSRGSRDIFLPYRRNVSPHKDATSSFSFLSFFLLSIPPFVNTTIFSLSSISPCVDTSPREIVEGNCYTDSLLLFVPPIKKKSIQFRRIDEGERLCIRYPISLVSKLILIPWNTVLFGIKTIT